MDEREQQISRLEEETIEREKKYYDSVKQIKQQNEQEMETLKACFLDYETEIMNLKQEWESSMDCKLEEEHKKWNTIVGELQKNLHIKDAAIDASRKELYGEREAGVISVSRELTCRVIQLSLLEVQLEERSQKEDFIDGGVCNVPKDLETEREELKVTVCGNNK